MYQEPDILFSANVWMVIILFSSLSAIVAYFVAALMARRRGRVMRKSVRAVAFVYCLVVFLLLVYSSVPTWGFGALVLASFLGLPLGAFFLSRYSSVAGSVPESPPVS